ncbi:hypothetical protein ACPA9J_00555 [Pseudomonas aeruginosa]
MVGGAALAALPFSPRALPQGRDPLGGLRQRPSRTADRRPGGCVPDLDLHLPPDLHRLPRRAEDPTPTPATGFPATLPADRADRAVDLRRRPDHPAAGWRPAATSVGHAGGEAKHSLELTSGAIAIAGILLAALLLLGQRRLVTALAKSARRAASSVPGGTTPGASTGCTTSCS